MDKESFISQVKDWLVETGTVKELQTKLRADLIRAITTQTAESGATKGRLKIKVNTSKNPETNHPFEGALNLMVIEHLMTRKLWYSSSVLANEADFAPFKPPDIEEVVITSASGNQTNVANKSQHPIKMTSSQISQVLDSLDDSRESLPNPIFVDHTSSEYGRDRGVSLLEVLIHKFMTEKGLASKPPAKMCHATSVQTQPTKEMVAKTTQTKDNLIQEIREAREQIERLKEENRQLKLKLEQEVKAKFGRQNNFQQIEIPTGVVSTGLQSEVIRGPQQPHREQNANIGAFQDPQYLAGAQDFVTRMRERISDLSLSNQQIMNTMSTQHN